MLRLADKLAGLTLKILLLLEHLFIRCEICVIDLFQKKSKKHSPSWPFINTVNTFPLFSADCFIGLRQI